MADFDEHNPLITSSAGQDNDLSDETQDFRFLSALSSSVILDPNQKFPKRGLKDFEANATKLQATALEASREAMHDALNHTRFHNAKGHVIALFDPVGNGAWVEKAKGTMFNTVGVWKKKEKRSDAPESLDDIEDESGPKQTGALWLRPEEALYLLERGTLDIRWSVSASAESTAISEGDPDEAGIPMSLQGAYAAFIGMEQPGGLTLEEYTVYAGLKRAGYTVIRAPAVATIELAMPKSDAEVPSVNAISRLFADFWKRIVNMEPEHPESRLKDGPLVTPGLYRSYSMHLVLSHFVQRPPLTGNR